MGNTADKPTSDTTFMCDKYPHMLETINKYHTDMVTIVDEPPLYRYDFFDRNKQLLDFHIMTQKKSYLFNALYNRKKVYLTIFSFANMKDIFNFSLTCRLTYVYWTRDDEIWRTLLSSSYKNSIIAAQPLNYHIYGIRSWRDSCKNIYCKEMWKRLQLQYEFVGGSMCSNNSDEEDEVGEEEQATNRTKKVQSKRSDKSSNQPLPTQITVEELRIHFICDEKKQARYLKSILKHCKEPQDTNNRFSKRFVNNFDRRVARVKERLVSNCSNKSNNSEFEIQCLVGTTLRPNCSCKFICIDLTEQNYQFKTSQSDSEIIKEYLSKEMECGETIREYLSNPNSCTSSHPNLSLVVLGLSYEKKNEVNPNMVRLAKAFSNEHSLPYIEIDVGRKSSRRDLLYYYSIYCHSKKMTTDQLTFLKTNNTNDEWLF